MPDPESAAALARADERAAAVMRDVDRVERTLSDRIDDLGDAVEAGFRQLNEKLDEKLETMMAEITALKVENGKRIGAERMLRWIIGIIITICIAVAGIVYSGHAPPPQQH